MDRHIQLYHTIYSLRKQAQETLSEEEKISLYIKIQNIYNEIPVKIRNSLVFKVAAYNNTTKCFYTNEECIIPVKVKEGYMSPWTATVEHLHPRKFGGTNDPTNMVIASKFVNNLFGNAPLCVKMEIRRKITKLKFLPWITQNQKTNIIQAFIRSELKSYKIPGITLNPWDWMNAVGDWKIILKNHYDSIINTLE